MCLTLVQVVNGTLWQFWGMLNSVVRGSGLLGTLQDLERQQSGYKYALYRTRTSALGSSVLTVPPSWSNAPTPTPPGAPAGSEPAPTPGNWDESLGLSLVLCSNISSHGAALSPRDSPMCASVTVEVGAGLGWQLCIAPMGAWSPNWWVAGMSRGQHGCQGCTGGVQ